MEPLLGNPSPEKLSSRPLPPPLCGRRLFYPTCTFTKLSFYVLAPWSIKGLAHSSYYTTILQREEFCWEPTVILTQTHAFSLSVQYMTSRSFAHLVPLPWRESSCFSFPKNVILQIRVGQFRWWWECLLPERQYWPGLGLLIFNRYTDITCVGKNWSYMSVLKCLKISI